MLEDLAAHLHFCRRGIWTSLSIYSCRPRARAPRFRRTFYGGALAPFHMLEDEIFISYRTFFLRDSEGPLCFLLSETLATGLTIGAME